TSTPATSTLSLHDALPIFEIEEPAARRGDVAAVDQPRHIPDPDEPTPGARADERSQLHLVEHERQHVAARARVFVDQHDLGAERSEEHTSELQSLAYLVCR